MRLLASGWPGSFSAQQVRHSHGTWHPQREHRKGDLLTLTSSAGHSHHCLLLAASLKFCAKSLVLLQVLKCLKSLVFVLWRQLRDLSPIPTLFLPLGVHWTLLGADATRLPTQCHGCLPGCWSQAGFGCWEGMVWARSSLLGATTLLPLLAYPRDHRHQWPNWGKPKRLDLFVLGSFFLFEPPCFGYQTAVTGLHIITEIFLNVFPQRFIRLQAVWIFTVTFCSTNFLRVFNMGTKLITCKKISQIHVTVVCGNPIF